MSEKVDDEQGASRPSTASSKAREDEQPRLSNESDGITGLPDSSHEDVEKQIPGHEFDMDLQSLHSVCFLFPPAKNFILLPLTS